jgi:hypothetical protein
MNRQGVDTSGVETFKNNPKAVCHGSEKAPKTKNEKGRFTSQKRVSSANVQKKKKNY